MSITNIKGNVRAFAPATVANVGCAFDILGFALEQPRDEVVARFTTEAGLSISAVHGDNGRLPHDPQKNTASVAAQAFLTHIGERRGIALEVFKGLPLGSGLGSSAASAVAGVLAVNALFGSPLAKEDLLPFALAGEKVACGSAHADNAAPALFGGFVLIRSAQPLDLIKIAAPEELRCVVVHPHIEVKTEDARRLLQRQITLADAVKQWGNIGGLIAGLYRADYELIGRSLEDGIIEPQRKLLVPGFDAVKRAALDAGALGCSLSGSGPAIFALFAGDQQVQDAAAAMRAAFKSVAIESSSIISRIACDGGGVLA